MCRLLRTPGGAPVVRPAPSPCTNCCRDYAWGLVGGHAQVVDSYSILASPLSYPMKVSCEITAPGISPDLCTKESRGPNVLQTAESVECWQKTQMQSSLYIKDGKHRHCNPEDMISCTSTLKAAL